MPERPPNAGVDQKQAKNYQHSESGHYQRVAHIPPLMFVHRDLTPNEMPTLRPALGTMTQSEYRRCMTSA